ncbi:type VI secretion system membrane subunit TssM (plasmid) [Sinorhizobium meliloti]|nr:type VI secretion system membrane subunit TssM [Sinorhizobium meliloti]
MQSIYKVLRVKWLRIVAVGLISAVIVIFSRHLSIGGIAPLDSLSEQIVASTLMPLAYVVYYMIQGNFEDIFLGRVSGMLDVVLARQKEGDVEASSSDQGKPRTSAAAEAELETMSARFRETRATLKGLRRHGIVGKRWLYQLPWYAIIGAPGSGKTTAIANSGLSFPLAGNFSRKSVKVVKGTRNCDWWFTDQAVLIDTPGHYTIHERNPDQDNAVWRGFLRLLSRSRRRHPLNGVLVSIAINELNSSSEEELVVYAQCIRQRILELYQELGLRVPIYVLLNKCDLIAGFNEFFDDLGAEGREAVWGFTFTQVPSESEADPMETYVAEYDALVGRLNDSLLRRMHQESNIQRRALVFGFPLQVASLKQLTHQFLEEAFARNSFEDPIMLRGVYFVSGRQVGTPFDSVIAASSRTFGITQPGERVSPDQRRSYFITRLLNELVFPDEGLVEAHPHAERRERWLRYGLRAAIGGVVASAAVFLVIGFVREARMIEGVNQTLSSYAQETEKLRLDRVHNSDFRPVLPLLERLREMKTGYEKAAESGSHLAGLKLYQSEELRVQTRAAYRHGLEAILLPRLIFRLETLLAQGQDDPPFLYQALKVYLMLGGRGPFQPKAVKDWMTLDWEVMFPAETDGRLRRTLIGHLNALLERPTNIALNSELIEKSRAKVRTISMPRRVLNIITTTPEAILLPTWRLSDHAGPAADVLIRKSGQPLNTGIAGIYTRAGFSEIFLRLLPPVVDAVAAEGWVLGDQAIPSANGSRKKLREEAVELYLQDFSFRWDGLVNDLSIRPMASVDDALRTLNALSAPTSPMRLFLSAMAQETKLGEPALEPTMKSKGITQGEPWGSDLQTLFRSRVVPGASGSQARLYTDEHFQWLHQLVDVPPNSPPGAQAPIDSIIRDLRTLYQALGDVEDKTISNVDKTAVAIRKIEAEATNLPLPIQQWVGGVGRLSSKLSVGDAKRRLAEMWAEGAGAQCRRATAGRYPFTRTSRLDIPLGDFARLFRGDGIIETFFAEHLATFVDRSEGAWKVPSTRSVELEINPDALAQFKRAAAIRASMFKDAGDQPSFEFLLTVADTDPSTDEVVVEIDGQTLAQRRGAYKPVRFRWPTVGGVGGASVTLNGFKRAALSEVGPWALLRLLDEGETFRQESSDRIYVRMTAGRQWATFILQADNLVNPLSRNLLSLFRCPQI